MYTCTSTYLTRSTEESLELRQRLEALEKVLESKGISVPETPLSVSLSPRKRRSSASPVHSEQYTTTVQDTYTDMPSMNPLPARASPPAIPPTAQRDDSVPPFAAPPVEEVHSVRFDFSEPPGGWSPHASVPMPSSSTIVSRTVQPVTAENRRELTLGTSPDDQSFGTLVISQSGRSKYLGPTAASEWLQDVSNRQQKWTDASKQEVPDSPPISRPQSPRPAGHAAASESGALPVAQFPFDGAERAVSTAYLLAKLPPLDEACVFIDAYYRYFAWQ